MIIWGSGHRPDKLEGYTENIFNRLVDLATAALKRYQIEKVISGMALGWDMALAQASINLKIPFIAAVPFDGQETRWPEESQKRYRELLANASEVVIVSKGYYMPYKMQTRNEWMVDHGDFGLVLWDGSPGGTANCVQYARKVGKQYTNLWPSWIKYK